MATLVLFHAHPDDEAVSTGGVMAKYAAAGHRIVLVVATRGEHGEVPDDLGPDETLADRRTAELMRSAAVLGVSRLEFLGYEDSGMDGWDQNHNHGNFWKADIDEAAERLARILLEEAADVLTVYDDHGNYGHPDHIQVHRVGHRAAELAATRAVYEATVNRDAVRRMMQLMADEVAGEGPSLTEDELEAFGSPEHLITTMVDVTAFASHKRDALACHASQVTDSSFFLQMPPERFTIAFGTEWFIKRGWKGPHLEYDLEGLG